MPHFYLGPWIWDAAPVNHWRAPIGCVGCVDLRSLPAQAIAGGPPAGLGFFSLSNRLSASDESTWQYLGDDPDRNLSGPRRNSWRDRLGLFVVPQGPKLGHVLYQTLTILADPSGDASPPPLLPDSDGILRASLAGMSFSKRLTQADPEWTGVRDRYRIDYRAMREASISGILPPEQYRKFLGVLLRKFRLREEDRGEFIPPGLPDESSLGPATTQTESFNKADNGLGPDQTWTDTEGTWAVRSNQCAPTGPGVNIFSYSRASGTVSSTDHYCELVVVTNTTVGSLLIGAAARFASGATTNYSTMMRNDAGVDSISLYKTVANTQTQLENVGITRSLPEAYRCECNGSTIRALQAGVERISVTDTAITTGTQGGVTEFGAEEANERGDNWKLEDLAAAAQAFKTYYDRGARWRSVASRGGYL